MNNMYLLLVRELIERENLKSTPHWLCNDRIFRLGKISNVTDLFGLLHFRVPSSRSQGSQVESHLGGREQELLHWWVVFTMVRLIYHRSRLFIGMELV